MAATPVRAKNTEQVLLGKQWSEASVEIARQKLNEDFSPLSDVRASSAYRLKVAQNLITRFFLESQSEHSDQVIDLAGVSS